MEVTSAIANARLGLDPRRTVLVIGPQFTAQCISHQGDVASFLSYKAIVEHGINALLDLEFEEDGAERTRRRVLLESAYELDPCFAAYKIVEGLRKHGCYEEWTKKLFPLTGELTSQEKCDSMLHILALQQAGARLVYTHCDELMANLLGLPAVVLEDEQDVLKWAQGSPAVLQLSGTISKLESMRLGCICYQDIVSRLPAAEIVRKQFQSKTVVMIGMDPPFHSPLLPKLLQTFVTSPQANLPLLVTHSTSSVESQVLTLQVDGVSHLPSLLSPSMLPQTPSAHKKTESFPLLHLVFQDRESSSIIFEVLKTVNYSSVQHTASQHLHHVTIEVDQSDFQELWTQVILCTEKMNGLLAFARQDGLTVWLCDKQQQQDLTKDLHPLHSNHTSSSSSSSLSSSSSSFSSSHLSSLTNPISSTPSFVPLQMGRGAFVRPSQIKQMNMAAYTQQHDLLRRIRSENDKLTLEDRLSGTPPRKNGQLVHQHSEPIILTDVGAVSGIVNNPISVPRPDVLMKLDGKLKEHQIECIDQFDHEEAQPPANDRTAHNKDGSSTQVSGSQKRNLFHDKKQKFKTDAIKFSETVSKRLVSSSPLTKIISPNYNEQRKILDKHFEKTDVPVLPSLATFPTFSNAGLTQPDILAPSTSTNSSPNQQMMMNNGVPLLLHSSNSLNQPIFGSSLPYITPYSMQPFRPSSSSPATISSFTPSTETTSSVLPSILPGSLALNMGEQKMLYMLPNGAFISTPVRGVLDDRANAAPSLKRFSSPNSDPDYPSRPLAKRRRSSSLPDVNQFMNGKTTSSVSSSSSATVTDPSNISPSSPLDLSKMPAASEQVFFRHVVDPHQYSPNSLPNTSPGTVGMPLRSDSNNELCTEDMSGASQVDDASLHPAPTGRGPIQLWQFLLDLLLNQSNKHLIHWTGNGYEFCIQQPEEVARLWGARKNKPRMNYDKLSRGLRYYYSKGIMDKVPGKKLTFKYTCNIQQYMLARNSASASSVMGKAAIV